MTSMIERQVKKELTNVKTFNCIEGWFTYDSQKKCAVIRLAAFFIRYGRLYVGRNFLLKDTRKKVLHSEKQTWSTFLWSSLWRTSAQSPKKSTITAANTSAISMSTCPSCATRRSHRRQTSSRAISVRPLMKFTIWTRWNARSCQPIALIRLWTEIFFVGLFKKPICKPFSLLVF